MHVCNLYTVWTIEIVRSEKNGKIQFKIGTYLSHRIKQPILELWIRIFMEFCDKLHFFSSLVCLFAFFSSKDKNKLKFCFHQKLVKKFVKIIRSSGIKYQRFKALWCLVKCWCWITLDIGIYFFFQSLRHIKTVLNQKFYGSYGNYV